MLLLLSTLNVKISRLCETCSFFRFTLLGRFGPFMLSHFRGPYPCIYTNPSTQPSFVVCTTADIQIQCSIYQFGVIMSIQNKQRRRFQQIEIENTQYRSFLRAPQPGRRAQTHRTPLSIPFRYTGVAASCRSLSRLASLFQASSC